MDTEYKFPKGVIIICLCQAFQQASYVLIQDYYRPIFQFELEMDRQEMDTIELINQYYSEESVIYLSLMILNSVIGKFRATVILSASEIITLLLFYIPLSFKNMFSYSSLFYICTPLILTIKCFSKGIKMNLILMGSEEFILPQQLNFFKYYCSVSYFIINLMITLSPFYSYIGVVMSYDYWKKWKYYAIILSLILSFAVLCCLWGGRNYYRQYIRDRKHFEVPKCFFYAIKNRSTRASGDSKEHWLDYAEGTCSQTAIQDVKICLNISKLFFVIPFYWTVYYSQLIEWKVQAGHLRKDFGSLFTVGEQKLFYANPFMVVILIPIFDVIIYPIFSKMKLLRTPLQRMATGGLITAVSLLICALVDSKLEEKYHIAVREGESHMKLYNGLSCDLQVYIPIILSERAIVAPFDVFHASDIPVTDERKLSVTFTTLCKNETNVRLQQKLVLTERRCSSFFVHSINNDNISCEMVSVDDYSFKPTNVKIRILFDLNNNHTCRARVTNRYNDKTVELRRGQVTSDSFTLTPPTEGLDLYVCEQLLGKFTLETGGFYSIIVNRHNNVFNFRIITIVPPNQYHVMLLFPQYFLMAIGEIMFTISGIFFTLMQAPITMRTELLGFWFIAKDLGLHIYRISGKFKIYEDTATEFLAFGGIFMVVMDTFILLTLRYRYVEPESNHKDYHLQEHTPTQTTE